MELDKQLTMFKELTEAPGVPGNEGAVRELLECFYGT